MLGAFPWSWDNEEGSPEWAVQYAIDRLNDALCELRKCRERHNLDDDAGVYGDVMRGVFKKTRHAFLELQKHRGYLIGARRTNETKTKAPGETEAPAE